MAIFGLGVLLDAPPAVLADLALGAGLGFPGRVAGAAEGGGAGGRFFGGALGGALADLERTGLGRARVFEAAADAGVIEAGVGVEGVGGVLGGGAEEEVAPGGAEGEDGGGGEKRVAPVGEAVGDQEEAAVAPLIDVVAGFWVRAGAGGVLVGAEKGGGGGEGDVAGIGVGEHRAALAQISERLLSS